MKCGKTWGGLSCGAKAQYLLICGCLQQHLHETPLCPSHMRDWISVAHNEDHSWTCTCGEPIQEWETTRIEKIREDYQPPPPHIKTVYPTISPWINPSQIKYTPKQP